MQRTFYSSKLINKPFSPLGESKVPGALFLLFHLSLHLIPSFRVRPLAFNFLTAVSSEFSVSSSIVSCQFLIVRFRPFLSSYRHRRNLLSETLTIPPYYPQPPRPSRIIPQKKWRKNYKSLSFPNLPPPHPKTLHFVLVSTRHAGVEAWDFRG